MYFEIIGEIENIETIAIGGRIRDIMRLRKQYGSAKWRKLKGVTRSAFRAEVSAMLRFTGMKHMAWAERS